MLLRALLLTLLTAAACWPTWSAPDLDGTEGRRVQIALEMLRSGDWMVPTLGGEPTWAKPPLHYWLLAAGERWLGGGVLVWRLPAVLAAAAAAVLAGELLRHWFGARAGWLGALGVACSPLVVFEWPTAEIDPLFASLTATSLWCLATGVARERRTLVVMAGVFGGLALLQKGPPYVLFALGSWLVWWRHRRLRGFAAYALPMLAVLLAYYVPLWLTRVAPGDMLAVVNEESVGRVAFFEWQHVRAIPLFWLRAVAVQLPFVLWCFWEWRGARDARMDPGDLTLRMCSAGAVLAVVLLTFFPGRPTRYLLPNVLLFTFAVAPAVAHFTGHQGLPRFARRLLLAVGVAGAVALLVLPFVPRAGIGALGLAAAAGVTPLLVRTPRAAVIATLVLPLVASWTVGLDRSLQRHASSRARAAPGALLRRALDAAGVDANELQTVGHFDSPLLLATGLLPPGDEQARAPWRTRWVLHELGGHPVVRPPANYVTRLRLDLPFKSFALCERVGAPK